MTAILRKELSELKPWAALATVLMLGCVVSLLMSEFDGYRDSDFFASELMVLFVFGSPLVALLIGFLQTVPEIRRDRWAFLIHRGVSATEIYLGKTAAGMGVYLLATVCPLIVAGLWCGRHGVEQYPFTWHQLRPVLAVVTASSGFYFAALLVVVRSARWYASRLLPFALPTVSLLLVVHDFYTMSEFVSVGAMLFVLAAVAIQAVTARGWFVRSDDSAGQPIHVKACLAGTLYPTWFAGWACIVWCVGAAFVVGVIGEDRFESSMRSDHASFRLNGKGEVIRFTYKISGKWPNAAMMLENYENLDNSDSREYDALLGTDIIDLLSHADPKPVSGWNGTPTTHVWYDYEWMGFLSGHGWGDRVLQPMGRWPHHFGIEWTLSAVDGWVYGHQEQRDPLENRLPPKLVSLIGPDGFCDAPDRPAKHFGRFLGIANSYGDGWLRYAWPTKSFNADENLGQYWLFDNGLFHVRLDKRTIQSIYTPPAGERIRSVTKTAEGNFAIVFADRVDVHEAYSAGVGIDSRDESEQKLVLPDALAYSIPLPDQVTCFGHIDFGQVPADGSFVFRCRGGARTWDFVRVVRTGPDGTVTSVNEYPDDHGNLRLPEITILAASAVAVPIGPFLGLSFVDAIDQWRQGSGLGLLMRLFIRNPIGFLCIFAVSAVVALVCGAYAKRVCRRYGFSVRERRRWWWMAVLFGPAGLATLISLRHWPACRSCDACGRSRPVDRDLCPGCGAAFAPPMADGTEIFATRSTAGELELVDAV